jgi:hypothetical protein
MIPGMIQKIRGSKKEEEPEDTPRKQHPSDGECAPTSSLIDIDQVPPMAHLNARLSISHFWPSQFLSVFF